MLLKIQFCSIFCYFIPKNISFQIDSCTHWSSYKFFTSLPLGHKWVLQTSMSISNLNNIQNFNFYLAENIVRIHTENILLMLCGIVISIGYENQMKTLCGKMPLHVTTILGNSNFSAVQYHLISFKYHFDVGEDFKIIYVFLVCHKTVPEP